MFNSCALPVVRQMSFRTLCVRHVVSGGHLMTDKQTDRQTFLYFYYQDFKFKPEHISSEGFISGYVMNIIPMIPVFTNNIMIDFTSNKPK